MGLEWYYPHTSIKFYCSYNKYYNLAYCKFWGFKHKNKATKMAIKFKYMWIFLGVLGGLILITITLWITVYLIGKWAQDLAEILRNFPNFHKF